MKFHNFLLFAALIVVSVSSNVIIEPKANGFDIKLPAGNIQMCAFHLSVNKPVVGVAAGDWNADVKSPTNGFFVYTVPVTLKKGDQVNYWVWMQLNGGQIEQILDRSWTHTGPPTTTQKPSPTTRRPTTKRRTTTRRPTTPKRTTPDGWTGTPIPERPGGQQTCQDEYPRVFCEEYPCLVFEDEFDQLDNKKWQHEITAGGGGNWEFQVYGNNRSNSYTRDGNLYIRPTLTVDAHTESGDTFLRSGLLDIWGGAEADRCTGAQFYGCFRQGTPTNLLNPVQSARLRTLKSFNMRYGRVEVRARMPTGDWLWPAIWMLPRRNQYGGWPASGEIDIMEARGNLRLVERDGTDVGVSMMGSTLHWGTDFWHNRYPKTHKSKHANSGNYGSDFHTYAVEWNRDGFTFTVDNEIVGEYNPPEGGFWEWGEFEKEKLDNPWAGRSKMAPFDQEFYIIFNVAVGGTAYFPDHLKNGGPPKPWRDDSTTAIRDFWNAKNNWLPTWKLDEENGEKAAMVIDYVRAWKMTPEDDDDDPRKE